MNSSDFIAILALVISAVSITYTIVVDRRKPSLKVRGTIIEVFNRAVNPVQREGPYFSVSATNYGPGRICVRGLALASRSSFRRWFRKTFKNDIQQGGVLDALPNSPSQLPMWLEVGESLNLYYPPGSDIITQEKFDGMYLFDSIGGHHWCQKGVIAQARESLAKRA